METNTQTLTHWKKNIDQNFICGEDLQSEIKGLKREMLVTIDHFGDNEAFDQKKNAKIQVTGLYLKDERGNPLFKPVVLNKINGRFLIEDTKSEYMEKWVGHKCVLWAQPDKRHGHVVRFKHYYPPVTVSDVKAIASLSAAKDIATLEANWAGLSAEEKKLPTVIAKAKELKGGFAV